MFRGHLPRCPLRSDVRGSWGLRHMTISDFKLKPSEAEPVRRLEIFTGAGRRRDWSAEEKARIVAESYDAGETVCGVARRHALSPQQLFTWRRLARQATAQVATLEPFFVPAVVAPSEAKRPPQSRKCKAARDAGLIELEIDGIAMRVGRGADAKTVAAVIRALKASS
jgi:transposase